MTKGKVLVVDDEEYIQHILNFSFGAEGYDVVTASDGAEGLSKAKDEKPDVIVMDIMMPRMDGYEACKKIKADPATRNIPVILLTAKGRDADRKLGSDAGADDYVVKPFSPGRLVERVEGIIKK
jgi:two-component system, OmpR family, alkaline phosphatase synthesis response regulator PhoP